ncbi:MAG: DUF58 domain-containing protein [Nitrospirae bacterium]|nr:DUF58 domain-containing protein [Nitrospirota bacterium]
MRRLFFDKDFLNRLEHLVFLSKRIHAGGKGGSRRSKNYGVGIEYADHREYNNGDDIRYIDWGLYARSGKLYTKLFQEDEDINIYILIDRSLSMDFGSPSKLQYALTLSASLGYVGLSMLDHVGAGYFSDDIEGLIPPRRGKNQLFPYLDFLSSFAPANATGLNRSLESFAAKVKTPGIVIILSDFFDEKGYERGLNYLLFRKFEVHAIQVLCTEEINPEVVGKLRLENMEDGIYSDMDVDKDGLDVYLDNLKRYNLGLKNFCGARGILYQQAVTDMQFDRLLMEYFQLQI